MIIRLLSKMCSLGSPTLFDIELLTQPSFYYQVFYICIANSFVNFYTYRLNPLLQSFTYLWQLVHNRSCGIKGNLITSNFITRFRSYQDVTFLKFIHASIFFLFTGCFSYCLCATSFSYGLLSIFLENSNVTQFFTIVQREIIFLEKH